MNKGYHLFEEYLKSKGVEYRYSKVRHPWTNRFAERFQRTLLEEFYQSNQLKRTYHTLKKHQHDMGRFLNFYNFQKNTSRL